MHLGSTENKKGPKTDLDSNFLHVVEQAMSIRGIQSDRAMSLELGRHPNFINRVRNGLQSAPPDAWDTLFAKCPAARNFSTTNVMSQGSGQAVCTVHGDNHYSLSTLEACQLELEQHKRDLANSRGEVERLRAELARADALVAAKEETITILKAAYGRPN